MPMLTIIITAAISVGVAVALTVLVLRLRAEKAKTEVAGRLAALDATVKARDEQVAEARRRGGEDEVTIAALRERVTVLDRNSARLEADLQRERSGAAEKAAMLAEAETRFKEAFDSLSAAALKSNNESFLALARTQLAGIQQQSSAELEQRKQAIDAMVKPIAESLAKVDGRIEAVERDRMEAHGSLVQLVEGVQQTQMKLQGETHNLVKALRAPNVRGRWGEIQLKRVVEIAGMVEHCDFTQQETIDTDTGKRRPDMIVKLPNGRCVVIDSKVPLSHYLEALETTDETARIAALRGHAAQVRHHLTALSARAYQDSLDVSPEFVVLFLPGETFFSAALEQDPALIEVGAEQKVILATPTTLIALLKAVSYGWRQEQLAENAREISENGRVLYDRTRTLAEHLVSVGKGLDRAVDSYNKAVGSLEHSFLPGARRFRDLGVGGDKEVPRVEGVERMTRTISIPELAIVAEE